MQLEVASFVIFWCELLDREAHHAPDVPGKKQLGANIWKEYLRRHHESGIWEETSERFLGRLWQDLGSLGITWDQLGSSGSIWAHLGLSAIIWDHGGSLGMIWTHLGQSRIIWSIWEHLGASGII